MHIVSSLTSITTCVYRILYIHVCRVSFFFSTQDDTCYFQRVKQHVVSKVKGYRTAGNENGLASALSNAGPVGVAIHSARPGFRNYRSGVYDDPNCSTTTLDHAVSVVGYDNNAWIVRNRYLHYLSHKPIIGLPLMYTENNSNLYRSLLIISLKFGKTCFFLYIHVC